MTEPSRPLFLGRVLSVPALRAAIDANPCLHSARLTLDYQAIMVELNRHLPDGRMVSLFDVKLAMDLFPVPAPTGVVSVGGRAHRPR